MFAMPKISAALRAARRRELAKSAKVSSATDPGARLSRRQRLAWLRLVRSENVGPATFRALVNEFGGAEAAIAALPALSRRGGRSHHGSPLDPRAAGTNNLLKQGACLVTSSRDIVETLAPILGRPHPAPTGLAAGDQRKPPEPLPDIGRSEREIIVGALGPSPVDIDELIRATGITTRKVQIVLLELDLAGRLQRHGQQLVSLKSPLA
jgi:predicted Rossmann fold nucleotide-binding protein DprA/Smf involved in DNA uptake